MAWLPPLSTTPRIGALKSKNPPALLAGSDLIYRQRRAARRCSQARWPKTAWPDGADNTSLHCPTRDSAGVADSNIPPNIVLGTGAQAS